MTTSTKLILLTLSLLALIWALFDFNQRRTASELAQSELVACQEIAAEIKALRAQNSVAFSIAESNHDFTRDLFSALNAAGIPRNSTLSAIPVAEYKDLGIVQKSINQPITEPVMLNQLVKFLRHLESTKFSYATDTIRLTQPKYKTLDSSLTAKRPELWTPSFRITYFEK